MTQAIGGTGSTTTPTTTTPTSIVQTATGAGAQSIGGLATGLDTNAIVAALVAAERALENPMKAEAALAQIKLQSYGLIRSDLANLTTAAQALSTPANWRLLTASSSDETIATVTAGAGTFGGTLSFTVDALAGAGSVRSANVISGTATDVAATPSIFVAAGGAGIGFATFKADNTLALGKHAITVTQASAAATKHGDTALAASTLVDGTNDTLNVDVNGTPTTLTLAHGTYTAAQLAQAVQDAATAAGAPLAATLLGSGKLSLATTREGTAATLQVTGGNALMALNLSTDGSALAGTDGALNVDGGATQTFSSLDAGQAVTLNVDAGGTIDAVFSGGLRTGTVTGTNVTTGDGSLATVIGNINSAGAGVTATAVQVGQNMYRLQLTSNTAGANNGENIDASVFDDAVGGLVTLTAAADARLTIGEGAGAYTVTSATNTVSGLLPGVTVKLKDQSTDTVTITVNRDDAGIADNVQKLVDAANQAKSTMDGLTKYDPNTQQASPLTGDSTVLRLVSALTNGFISAVSGATPASPGLAGVSIDQNGNFTFNRAKFVAAFDANPEGVTKLFAQGGTATNAGVQFVSAGDGAVAGTYDVVVTQAATQATATGLTGAWPPGVLPTVTVRIGTTEVSYAVNGGDTRADVADGLNAAFASAGFNLQAIDTGSGVKISTNDYGSRADFDVDWDDGAGFSSYEGVDVAGTIGGKTAVGNGQQLLVPFTDNQIPGLALLVTTTDTGALGSFTYSPGVAQRVESAVHFATDAITGYITSSEKDYQARIKFDNAQITQMEVRVSAFEVRLRAQWAQLESTIATLHSQGNWLSSQVDALTAK